MLPALAMLAVMLLAIVITLWIVALRARQDRASARLALRRGPWRWRR